MGKIKKWMESFIKEPHPMTVIRSWGEALFVFERRIFHLVSAPRYGIRLLTVIIQLVCNLEAEFFWMNSVIIREKNHKIKI